MDLSMHNDSWERLSRAIAEDTSDCAMSQSDFIPNVVTIGQTDDGYNNDAFLDYVTPSMDNYVSNYYYDDENENQFFTNNVLHKQINYLDDNNGCDFQAASQQITCEPWNETPSGTLMQLDSSFNYYQPCHLTPHLNDTVERDYNDCPSFQRQDFYHSFSMENSPIVNHTLPYKSPSECTTSAESQQCFIDSSQYSCSPHTAELSYFMTAPSSFAQSDTHSGDDELNLDSPSVSSGSRGRGRPKVYKTEAEKRAARANSQKRYEERRKNEQRQFERQLETEIKKLNKLNQVLRKEYTSIDHQCRELLRTNQMLDCNIDYIQEENLFVIQCDCKERVPLND